MVSMIGSSEMSVATECALLAHDCGHGQSCRVVYQCNVIDLAPFKVRDRRGIEGTGEQWNYLDI